jgi:hypothetical protein
MPLSIVKNPPASRDFVMPRQRERAADLRSGGGEQCIEPCVPVDPSTIELAENTATFEAEVLGNSVGAGIFGRDFVKMKSSTHAIWSSS